MKNWTISHQPDPLFPWVARDGHGGFIIAMTRWGVKRQVKDAMRAEFLAERDSEKIAAEVAKLNAELREMK